MTMMMIIIIIIIVTKIKVTLSHKNVAGAHQKCHSGFESKNNVTSINK